MPQEYIVSVPLEELKRTLTESVKEEIKRCLLELQAPKPEPEYITRKEAAQILGVSLVTLGKWTSEGVITGYRIAKRIRFKKSEVYESLNKIATFKRNNFNLLGE